MPDTPSRVNAFTANGRNGNPAGVVLGADALDERQMLAVASGLGLSETAFVSQSDRATRKVRFFTPTTEVDLCGHATIATWSLLHKLGELSVGTYTQETKAGLLKVEIQNEGLVFMEQTRAAFFDKVEPPEVAGMLGIKASDFHASLHPQIVSTGIRDLLVPLIDKSVLARLRPNLDAIADFSRRHDISGFHVFALLENEQSLASARNFAPADGIPEECATGTSNGALLCYLKNERTLPQREIYRVEQGEAMGRLSYIYGTFKDEIVWIGGQAEIIDRPGL
ncbi:MAG TPA: PhzF family phenazine biosynthesis protein [Candidatus Saccharimonadia bacterium]|nr:PhzF family phenazine biosynthesis protein [Candidatus Saccharimonadia bacterium]